MLENLESLETSISAGAQRMSHPPNVRPIPNIRLSVDEFLLGGAQLNCYTF